MTEIYEVGDRRAGVRWSRAELDAPLRRIVRSAIGVGEAPANISVVLGEGSGRTRTKHHLYLQGEVMSAGSGDGGLVRSLLRSLTAFLADAPPEAIWIRALLVIDPSGALTAVDRRVTEDLRRLEPRLRRSGHRIIALPGVHVQPGTGTAIVPDCTQILGVDVDELERTWPRQGTDDDLRAGDLRISRLVYRGWPEPASQAAAIGDMVPLVWDADGWVRTSDVAQLVTLADTVETVGVPGQDPRALRSALGLDRT